LGERKKKREKKKRKNMGGKREQTERKWCKKGKRLVLMGP
jgi:hypothetical protein